MKRKLLSLVLCRSQVRALSRLGLMGAAEYLVGVSGGSWFSSAFTYSQLGTTDEELLCPYSGPANLTDAFLADGAPKGCLLKAPQCDFYVCIAAEIAKGVIDPWCVGCAGAARAKSGAGLTRATRASACYQVCARPAPCFNRYASQLAAALLARYTLDRVWVTCTAECYLKPVGIGRNDLFTLSAADASDIKRRNPTLQDATFITPSSGGPRPCTWRRACKRRE